MERLKLAVSTHYPDVIYGQYNCKRRNGWNWSQHAGSEPAKGYKGNAVDIVHKDHGYGDKTPAHQAYLDEVYGYLQQGSNALDINELIWRKLRHYDHIHTSCWPKLYDAGLYTPPCHGGELIVVNKDGTEGDTFDVLGAPPNMGANMSYIDMQPTEVWAEKLGEEDIDRMYDLGIQRPDNETERNFWKGLLTDPGNPQWENYRLIASTRTPLWQPGGEGDDGGTHTHPASTTVGPT